MTELTEKAIATEQNQIKALEEEYQKRTQEYLAFQVDSALDYKGSESVLEDWDNCPEILIRLIIQLQRHTKAVCTHLKQRSLEETTESLRSYAEDNVMGLKQCQSNLPSLKNLRRCSATSDVLRKTRLFWLIKKR
jgi:hypothetical protein